MPRKTTLEPAGEVITTANNAIPDRTVKIPKSRGYAEALSEPPPRSFFLLALCRGAPLLEEGDREAFGGGSLGADNCLSPSVPGLRDYKMILARLPHMQHHLAGIGR